MPAKFEPDKSQRFTVQMAKLIGIPTASIAKLVKNPRTGKAITEKTMLNAFREELDTAKISVDVVCAGKVVQAMMEGQAWAVCFYAKTQMGWKEGVNIEHSGAVDIQSQGNSARDKLKKRIAANERNADDPGSGTP